MTRAAFVRRHRAGIASGAALVVVSAAVVAYAVTAQGYKAHEAELNDGGIWVVNGKKGWSGRLNKPINQLDGVVPSQDGRTRLDVVQDGAAVVTLDLRAARGQAIETARLEAQDGGAAAVPVTGSVRMAGGTLASADAETGDVWAVRFDDRAGSPLMSAVDRQADPLLETGGRAALTVTQAGTLVVTSADDGTVTRVSGDGASFGEPETQDLPGDAGQVVAVSAVGERVVTLDETGVLRVLDGATAQVPAGSELQQAGPDAGSVLVGAPEGLLEVDLDSGSTSTVSTRSGDPVAPVRLGACVYGAWSGGVGALAVRCGSQDVVENDLGGDATSLAFRVNRGEIVLNDATSGAVWDVDQDRPVKIDNWEAFTSKKQDEDDDEDNRNQTDADRRPPRAKPDSYGVRPGRSTVLHPLDNDSAPEGRLLSIVDVDQPSGGARVEISPDGQSLVLQMPEKARPARFEYFIDDGRNGLSAHAAVDVEVREGTDNTAPELRRGYRRPTYKVPHGGTLAVPVLADWRDDRDGDALLLDSARAVGGDETGATARTTADGRIRFTAPSTPADGPQLVRVDLTVTDGRSAPVRRSIGFEVQAPRDQKSFPPTAEPDVVRGEVGQPIKVRPLLNDLPGSDPSAPHADLALAGKVPQQPGVRIVSDLESGQLTVTGERPGTYFLRYDAGYGNAPLDQGTIRVDVKPRPQRRADPIAMPDTLTIYGQAPGIVDVLANDLDPAGGLLTVQRAAADRAGQLDVAIIDGRWLRISSIQPRLAPETQTVAYTITNGPNAGARGEVVVTQRDAPADNTPITAEDRVVVRAGSSVSVPVLDNDVSPSGDRLTLLGDPSDGQGAGRLEVDAPVDVTGDVGQAFVSGRVVRYNAPATLAERDTYTVTYVAQNLDGLRANGVLRVTVVPLDDPNDAPDPPTLEGRVVSADTVKVRLPGTGVDRNGDPVTVTGITSAPRLGRIVSYGGNFLEYQAYPRTVGTDEFSYAVVDSAGAFATGTVRIAVAEPGEPQPPLAVADRLTVEPGRTATLDPLANDFVAPGDSVEVELLDAPAGVSLDPRTNLVTVPPARSAEAPPVVIVYRVTNGLAESRATMTLQTAEGHDNPPVVFDAFGRADDSGSVVIDVLEGAYDPDGPVEGLTVTSVTGDASARVVDGTKVRVDRGPEPKVLPFVVEDADGASATASVYVPPTGNGLPHVVDGALVRLEAGGSATGRLSDLVEAPEGAEVRLASGKQSWSASPSAISVTADGAQKYTVSAAPGFRGPGALLVEVTSARDASGNEDAGTTADGATVLLSVPVQVGDEKPTLECPATVLPISAGQRVDLDVATFCTVFTLDPRDEADLAYAAGWGQGIDGVDVGTPVGSVVTVTAADTATEGGEGVLEVRAGDSNTAQVRFRLAAAPSPTLLPIRVEEMEAGQSRSIDIGAYLRAGVADPRPSIVSVQSTGNPGVTASVSGSRLTLRAGADASGAKARFRLVVSDVSSTDPPPSRRAEGSIEFQVVGRPSTPGPPRPYRRPDLTNALQMSWAPPDDDGGAPIRYYVVREEKSRDTRRCATNECIFRGLTNGRTYSFRVQAVNRVGASEWSELSQTAQADTAPGRVRDIEMVSRGDHTITIGWGKPATQTSQVLSYAISWRGGSAEVPGDTQRFVATGLDNNATYEFQVKAENRVGYGLARGSDAFQPLGTPLAPPAPAVTDLETGANQTSARISWKSVLPEGPGPVTYTVSWSTATSSGVVPGCQRTTSLSCVHSGIEYDGQVYTYRVTASNVANRSQPSEGTTLDAVGRPAQWGGWSVEPTGTDQQLRVTATAPDPRGTKGTVAILVGGTVVREVGVVAGQGISEVVNTSSNESPVQVQLRICNEDAARGGCTSSSSAVAQSYGPFSNSHLDPISWDVSGKHIVFHVSGTSNGNQGILSYSVDNGPEQRVRPAGNGAFTLNIEVDAADYSTNVRLDAWLWDDAPTGRGTTDEQTTARAGDPPPPTVTIQKHHSCNDGDADNTNDCTNLGALGCTGPRCGILSITVSGARENFGCLVTTSTAGQNNGRYWANMSNGETVTDWVFDNGYIEVTCEAGRGGPNYFKVTDGYDWPG